jgi:hypothetical protein
MENREETPEQRRAHLAARKSESRKRLAMENREEELQKREKRRATETRPEQRQTDGYATPENDQEDDSTMSSHGADGNHAGGSSGVEGEEPGGRDATDVFGIKGWTQGLDRGYASRVRAAVECSLEMMVKGTLGNIARNVWRERQAERGSGCSLASF